MIEDNRKLKRENLSNNLIKISFNDQILEVNLKDFMNKIGKLKNISNSSIIRIEEKEYSKIPKEKYITHFNIEQSFHKKESIYILPKIIKKGYFHEGIEELPILDFSNSIIAKCLKCRENISYDNLIESDFTYSFSNILNKDELLQEIYRRYKVSIPNLTMELAEELGVSITDLEIIGEISKKEYETVFLNLKNR